MLGALVFKSNDFSQFIIEFFYYVSSCPVLNMYSPINNGGISSTKNLFQNNLNFQETKKYMINLVQQVQSSVDAYREIYIKIRVIDTYCKDSYQNIFPIFLSAQNFQS